MGRKKHKNAHRRAKKQEPQSTGSKRKFFIGAAMIAVLSVAGMIWARVNQESSSATDNPAGTGAATQPESQPGTADPVQGSPQIKISTPPSSGSTGQLSSPQLKVTLNPPSPVPAAGTPAPDFALQELGGQPVQISKLKGRVIAINFWATWCGPCRAEIPGFLKAYEKLKPKGLEIVGVSTDHAGRAVVEEFVKKFEIKYPVVMDTAQVAQKYGGLTGIPTTFIIDRQGRVARRHVGYIDQASFEQLVAPLL